MQAVPVGEQKKVDENEKARLAEQEERLGNINKNGGVGQDALKKVRENQQQQIEREQQMIKSGDSPSNDSLSDDSSSNEEDCHNPPCKTPAGKHRLSDGHDHSSPS